MLGIMMQISQLWLLYFTQGLRGVMLPFHELILLSLKKHNQEEYRRNTSFRLMFFSPLLHNASLFLSQEEKTCYC